MRDYGIGIQILKDLGLSRVRLLTNNPKKTDAFIYGGFNLTVVDQVALAARVNEHNAHYLQTKRDKLGHQFPDTVSQELDSQVRHDRPATESSSDPRHSSPS